MNVIQSGIMQGKETIMQEPFVGGSTLGGLANKLSEGPSKVGEPSGKQKFDLAMLSDEDKAQLEEELQRNNEKFAFTGKYLKFRFDEEAETTFVDVIDSSTHEVIVSLPPEFLIDLSIKMKKILGMYIDEKL